MKKLFLLTLLCTAATLFGATSNKLVQAIQYSDYQKVQQLTDGMILTATEQLALTDLAQNIIFNRNRELECRKLEEQFGSLQKEDGSTEALLTLFVILGGGAFSFAYLSSAIDKNASIGLNNRLMYGAISLGIFVSTFFITKKLAKIYIQLDKAYKEKGEKLKQDCDNALNIKQLLMLLPVEK
jgi:hypothetical protein